MTLILSLSELAVELEAVALLSADVTAPEALDSIALLRTGVERVMDQHGPEIKAWTTGLVPWRSVPLQRDGELELPGRRLEAKAGTVLQVSVHWDLQPQPRPLRQADVLARVTRGAILVSVEPAEEQPAALMLPAPVLACHLPVSGLPATPASVIEGLIAVFFPSEWSQGLIRHTNELSEWHELYRARYVRLIEWQQFLASSAEPIRAFRRPADEDVFVRPLSPRTRPGSR